MPAEASIYAIPEAWRERWGIRRYGFHGLSHSYASRRAAELLERSPVGLRVVTCHLGAGASLAAVRDGVSVDTTMGFTPLEGLVMATRSGDFDPGAVLWLQEQGGLSAAEVSAALEHRSGLLGLAGTSDMRAVVAAADAGEANGRLALDVYLHRLRAGIAAMTAALGGLDAWSIPAAWGRTPRSCAPARRPVWSSWGSPSITHETTRLTATPTSRLRERPCVPWSWRHARTLRSPARFVECCCTEMSQ